MDNGKKTMKLRMLSYAYRWKNNQIFSWDISQAFKNASENLFTRWWWCTRAKCWLTSNCPMKTFMKLFHKTIKGDEKFFVNSNPLFLWSWYIHTYKLSTELRNVTICNFKEFLFRIFNLKLYICSFSILTGNTEKV